MEFDTPFAPCSHSPQATSGWTWAHRGPVAWPGERLRKSARGRSAARIARHLRAHACPRRGREMLRVSKLTDYGTLVMTQMASSPGRLFSVAELAEMLRLNAPTVSKVLKALGRHNLVTSVRGTRGGYALARPAKTISVAQIVDALEEQPFGLTECSALSGSCELESGCRIRANWQRINTAVRGC